MAILKGNAHILSVLVENRFGVLARVAGLVSGRSFNIDSLSVAETDDPDVSHMTIVTHGDDQIIEQIEKQLNRLIDVIKVRDLTAEHHVERELALVKVDCDFFIFFWASAAAFAVSYGWCCIRDCVCWNWAIFCTEIVQQSGAKWSGEENATFDQSLIHI